MPQTAIARAFASERNMGAGIWNARRRRIHLLETVMTGKARLRGALAWPVRTIKRFGADRGAPMAASIAFYSAFSLAPTSW